MKNKNIYDKVRLFFRKDKEPYLNLYRITGFVPHNLELYRTALKHKSYRGREMRDERRETRDEKRGTRDKRRKTYAENNERLEYLGDAILGAIVADVLFKKYPKQQEGYLSTLRSKIVRRNTLNQVAQQIGLDKLILSDNHKSSSHNSYMNGNAFEAFVGAIYLDQGWRVCKKFIEEKILSVQINVEKVAHTEENFKSKLIEWCQKYQLQCVFDVVEEKKSESQNSIIFKTIINIEGMECGRGAGYSKKESHQKAAKNAMTKLRKDVAFVNDIFAKRNKRK